MQKRRAKNGKRRNGGSEQKLEKMLVSRLRTNTTEFATNVRAQIFDSNTGAVTAQSYCFFLNYPTYYRNAAGTIAQMSNFSGVLGNEQKVLDEYKVVALKVMYMPWITQVRVNTAVAFTSPTDPALIMSIDYDDGGLWTTFAKALSSQNPAIFSSYSDRMPTIVMRQHDKVQRESWLNTQAMVPNATTPPDPNNAVGKLSAVKIWKQGYQLASTAEGAVFAEWTVLYRGVYTLA